MNSIQGLLRSFRTEHALAAKNVNVFLSYPNTQKKNAVSTIWKIKMSL